LRKTQIAVCGTLITLLVTFSSTAAKAMAVENYSTGYSQIAPGATSTTVIWGARRDNVTPRISESKVVSALSASNKGMLIVNTPSAVSPGCWVQAGQVVFATFNAFASVYRGPIAAIAAWGNFVRVIATEPKSKDGRYFVC
jgi:hypothetical protein